MGKRMDPQDTIDTATHFLHRLQAEGWALSDLEHSIEYAGVSPKGVRLPVSASVSIKLIPIRG